MLSRIVRDRLGLAGALLAAALVFSVAGPAAAAEPWERNAAFFDKREPVAQASGAGGGGAPLRARVHEEGRLRVLVELDLRTPAAAGSAAGAGEAATLAGVQDAVVAATFGTRTAMSGGDSAEAPIHRFEVVPFLSLVVRPAELERLIADGRVLSIQEDVPVPPTLHEALRVIDADKAHEAGFVGRGVAVAVLDTGFDRKHAMLKGHIVLEACFSSKVSRQSTSLCPGGRSRAEGAGAARPCPSSVTSCDHGTHVASIAVGSSARRDGVAPRAGLLAVQIFSRFDSDRYCGRGYAPCVLSYTTDQIAALEYVYKHRNETNLAAVNLSLGGGGYKNYCDSVEPAMTAIIGKLLDTGIATVIAAGNGGLDGKIASPACIRAAIAVAASTNRDQIAAYSNFGKLVDLIAPGSDVLAAVPGGYATMSGTSMAAPMVSGAIAVLRQVRPSAGVGAVYGALANTGEEIYRNSHHSQRIDVDAAIKYLRGPSE